MVKRSATKRPLQSTSQASKKRKVADDGDKTTRVRTVPKKEKASQRKTIPIPEVAASDDSEVDEEDLEFFKDQPDAGQFLDKLDRKGIARSKVETDRLHKLSKPARRAVEDDDLPSINSHDDDSELWNSDIGEEIDSVVDSDDFDDDSLSEPEAGPSKPRSNFDEEQTYELKPRRQPAKLDEEKGPERLPIKLANGQIKKRGNLPALPKERADSESEDETEAAKGAPRNHYGDHLGSLVEDVATGARFGRPSVAAVIGNKSRKARIQGAKEQLANICQEIVADPENSLGLLRRLHSFSLPSLTTPASPKPVVNDVVVRQLALLSQLAVFKDIIPGYRIRPLTDIEKSEKVSQMVQRTRDWEQGLVGVYQNYLQMLESELKHKSELAEVALQCMCTLLIELTHFNFRVNLMNAVVARLSKKSWDAASDSCINALNTVLRKDQTGEASLEIVRLLNRMIKERRFNIHPNVLSCLLNLRLKSELGGVRASLGRSTKDDDSTRKPRYKDKKRNGKAKFDPKPHLSKNAKKAAKENKEIEEEMHEAEAEVDREERSKTHTETLKLLFVLYFRILKNPRPTPLLPGALDGLSRFAHLVNIDFFKDLLAVLKQLITRENEAEQADSEEEKEGEEPHEEFILHDAESLRQRLMCIVTAFELLSGQGEALTLDLTDFVSHLYAIILQLATSPDIDDVPRDSKPSRAPVAKDQKKPAAPPVRRGANATTSDLLFRALSLVFTLRSSAGTSPPWRSAAFAKRLLTCALQWPPTTALKALEFVRTLLVKEPTLDALLSTEDRVTDGVYRPELDDPQLSNPFASSFWELRLLERSHWDATVREEARKLANFRR